jgi:hypothetical protein
MRSRLRWFGHIERKGDDDWVRKCTELIVDGKRPRSLDILRGMGRMIG